MLKSDRIGVNEDIDDTDGKTAEEVAEMIREKEAKERALVLEMIGDIPDADIKPPENVLFVCKLNPVTREEDLEVIFSRFGPISSCEVIRDQKSGDSLQYAFIEFEREEDCEKAYFKMDNVLIDDRRIHVDFSQSVSTIKWFGKGKGATIVKDFKDKKHFDDKPRDNLKLKTSAFGQRTDQNYGYVYDDNQYQVMIPTGNTTRTHKSADRPSYEERHHRNKRSRSRSKDKSKVRERDRERHRDYDKHSDRDRKHKSERKHSHKSSRDKESTGRRHRYSSSPERNTHSKSHRHRH